MAGSSVIQMISAVLFCTLLTASAIQIGERSRISSVGAEEAPYHVSIWFNNNFQCSGTMLDFDQILTVAHCVMGMSSENYANVKVKSGSNNRLSGGEEHSVESIFIHPNFTFAANGFHKHDIAVIKLTERISMSAYQQGVLMTRRPLATGTEAILTGWGRNADYSLLKKARSTVISNELCQEKVNNQLQENEFCTFDDTERDICVGKPGSPLVKDYKLYGMLTWAGECGSESPEVYINVAPYRAFIAGTLSPNN